MNAPGDTPVWLLALVLVVCVLLPLALFAVLGYFTLRLLRWLGAEFAAIVPAPYGRWIVGIAKFYYVAALFCGLTAFGVSLAILRAPVPERLNDPIQRNPLLWLTWLAVMTGIMIGGIIVGVVLRDAFARLRKGFEEVRNSGASGE
jgi:hypothetical protein